MANNLLNVWSTVGSVVLAILILLAMITIHEFGHWVAGTILRFKINEFSIGFGPALFKRKSKKSGQIFALRLIPLGGYCAFDGEDGVEEEPPQEPVFEEEKPPVSEDTVIVTESPQAEEDGKEKPQAASAPVPEKLEEKREAPRLGKFTEMKPWKRIIVLVAGALMNYLLALLLIIVCFFAYGQTEIKLTGVAEAENETQAEYSFREGDILLRAGGRDLYLTMDIARAVNGKSKGDTVDFVVLREGKREKVSVMMRDDVKVKNSASTSSVWRALGVGVVEREDGKYYALDNTTCKFGFFETLGRSFVYSFKIAGSIFQVIGELLTGRLGISALGGPVTTITMTSQVVSQGFRSFLEIAGFIGVNLAVFNLLPIPALDGSKVIFTVIEWIRGKPVNRKVEAIIHAVGFILLLGFAVLVDILQFVL